MSVIISLLDPAEMTRMARGEKTEEECAEIRTNLLRYCQQDTLGMVRVHQALARQVASTSTSPRSTPGEMKGHGKAGQVNAS